MPEDKYSNFEQLFKGEVVDVDYKIVIQDRGADDLIMAPHGGKIEPGTSEIAQSIAGGVRSLYLFEGLKLRLNRELHVTSHNYDEPKALGLAAKSDRIVAIHGRKDCGDPDTVWAGGLDTDTGKKIVQQLQEAGFCCEVRSDKFPGMDPHNICNRGLKSRGVQLELPKSLRERLCSDVGCMSRFSDAVNKALSNNI